MIEIILLIILGGCAVLLFLWADRKEAEEFADAIYEAGVALEDMHDSLERTLDDLNDKMKIARGDMIYGEVVHKDPEPTPMLSESIDAGEPR